MDFIVDSIHKGGPFMWPILFCAVFALAIAFERLYFIMFQANINGTAFMAQVQKLIMANNIDRAIKLCNAEPHAALPKVVKAGLTRANRTEKEIENAIEEAPLEDRALEDIVGRVIDEIAAEGQLDESGLAFGDLRPIRVAFVGVLREMLLRTDRAPALKCRWA